jgi:hypothetical protein
MIITNSNTDIQYGVKINGVITNKFTLKRLAEKALDDLPADQQHLAEIVSLDADGREILFG